MTNKVLIVLPRLLLARKVLVCGYSWKALCRAVEGPRRVSVGLDANGMCEIGLNLLEAEQFVQCSPKPISEIVWVSHLFFTRLPNCFSKTQLIHLFTVARALKGIRVRIYARDGKLDGNYGDNLMLGLAIILSRPETMDSVVKALGLGL